MPTGPKGQKRPADVIGNAVKVMRIATGQIKEPPQRRKAPAPDLATVDDDDWLLLLTRKAKAARATKRGRKTQAKRSTKGN